MSLIHINGKGEGHAVDARVDDLVLRASHTNADVTDLVEWVNSLWLEYARKTAALEARIDALPPPVALPEVPSLAPLEARVTDLDERLVMIRKILEVMTEHYEMNNSEKQAIIDQLKDYWSAQHPDCFMDLADGRKVFKEELLGYKHDLLLRDLLTRKEPAPAPPPAPTQKTWPMWVAIAALMLFEVASRVW